MGRLEKIGSECCDVHSEYSVPLPSIITNMSTFLSHRKPLSSTNAVIRKYIIYQNCAFKYHRQGQTAIANG